MKYFQITLYLCLFSINLFSQIEWEELEAHNAATLQIIHVTADNELIAYMDNPVQLMVSSDQGESWDILFYSGKLPVPRSHDPSIIKKHNGEYYLRDEEVLYKYDTTAMDFLEYLNLEDEFWSFDDFDWLPNGNLIVGDGGDIIVYDSELNELASTEWQSHSLRFIIGENDTHYAVRNLGASRSLVKFNSNLNGIVLYDFGSLSYRNENSIFVDEILNSEEAFSTDGINWTRYQYQGDYISGPFYLNDNGDLFVVNRQELYKSTDRGEHFTKLSDIPTERFWDVRFIHAFGEKIFVSIEQNCARTDFLTSENGIDQWQSINVPEGNPFAERVEVVSENNIFISSCGTYDKFKTFDQPEWQNFDASNSLLQNEYFGHLFSFPDGSIYSDGVSESVDEGRTWIEKFPVSLSWYDQGFRYKNGNFYMIDHLEMYKSIDQGSSWEVSTLQESLYDDIYDISASEHIFSIGFLGVDGEINKYNKSMELLSTTLFTEDSPVSIVCSYTGSDVFVLTRSWSSSPKIYVSHDDGETFTPKVLDIPTDEIENYESRLESDQFGNLYMILEKSIYLSQDGAETWLDITPDDLNLITINDVDISHDGYLYMATTGLPIIKSSIPIREPNRLSVILYHDEDGNCEFTQDENIVPNININIGDVYQRTTDLEGEISMYLLSGTYDVVADLRSDLYYSCNNEQAVTFNGDGELQTLYIPVEILQECTDLELGVSTPIIRRCFENEIIFEIENTGTLATSNTELRVELDEFFEYVSCDFELISVDGHVYTFDVGIVPANEIVRGKLRYVLSCDAELGAPHYFTAALTYDNQCMISQGSARSFTCQENIGSYDPNDMIGYINGIADHEVFASSDTLEYLIRFQNTGTDTAFTVRIEDLIGPEFDQESLEPISASHDYEWSIERNLLTVRFDNILLVDSFANEEDSHGFVKFRIDLKPTDLDPGDVIDNTAAIYFDFNDPIITNTVDIHYLCKHVESYIDIRICEGDSYEGYSESGTFTDFFTTELMCDSTRHLNLTVWPLDDESCIVNTEEIDQLDLKIYPIPSIEILYVESRGAEIMNYEVMNLSGQSILKGEKIKGDGLDISQLADGFYFLKVTSFEGGSAIQKFVKAE